MNTPKLDAFIATIPDRELPGHCPLRVCVRDSALTNASDTVYVEKAAPESELDAIALATAKMIIDDLASYFPEYVTPKAYWHVVRAHGHVRRFASIQAAIGYLSRLGVDTALGICEDSQMLTIAGDRVTLERIPRR